MNRYIVVMLLIVFFTGIPAASFGQEYGPSYDVDKYSRRKDEHGNTGIPMPSGSVGSSDKNACWMASASNILIYTGWVAAEHGNSVQDVYDTFLRHFDGTETGTLNRALDHYIPTYWSGMDFSLWWATNVVGFISMDDLRQRLHDGYGVHLSISAFGGHVINPWQIELNSDGTSGRVLVTDSQDGVDQERWYDLRLDHGVWHLDGYTLDSARTGNIEIREQYTFAVRQNPLLNDPYPIGRYADGHRDVPISYAFVGAYQTNGGQNMFGTPDSSPGETPYLHTWGPFLLQDFNGGQYGDAAIIYNPDFGSAYVVRTGFWDTFRNLEGQCRDNLLGPPRSDEYAPDSGQAVGGNKITSIQDFAYGHMEFYTQGCSFLGGCIDIYSRQLGSENGDTTCGLSAEYQTTLKTVYAEPASYRPQAYKVTTKIRKDLLNLRHGDIFDLVWSMECGNDLIRLAGTYNEDDWGWVFSYDAVNDAAGGNEAFETFRLGATFDVEYLYVELTTNYPIRGVMSEYGLGLLSPGDLYVNVGGSLLDHTGTLFGLGLTTHSGDMTGQADTADNIYTWNSVQQGHLYADVIFATGTFESYIGSDEWFEDGGYDPFGRNNNIPTLIAQWGQDLGYQGNITWQTSVPEPGTMFLISSGLIGIAIFRRKRAK